MRKSREVFNFICAVWLVLVPAAALVFFYGRSYKICALMCYFAYWNMLLLCSKTTKGV